MSLEKKLMVYMTGCMQPSKLIDNQTRHGYPAAKPRCANLCNQDGGGCILGLCQQAILALHSEPVYMAPSNQISVAVLKTKISAPPQLPLLQIAHPGVRCRLWPKSWR